MKLLLEVNSARKPVRPFKNAEIYIDLYVLFKFYHSFVNFIILVLFTHYRKQNLLLCHFIQRNI